MKHGLVLKVAVAAEVEDAAMAVVEAAGAVGVAAATVVVAGAGAAEVAAVAVAAAANANIKRDQASQIYFHKVSSARAGLTFLSFFFARIGPSTSFRAGSYSVRIVC